MAEMTTLDWRQVNLAQRTIFLEKTKNGSKRQVPVSTPLMKALGQPGEGPVFPWSKKATSLVSQLWAARFEQAGCPDLRFHDLRHEATARLYERTKLTDMEVALITGHTDPRMLMRYANLRASTLAAKLW
jgi:integrase